MTDDLLKEAIETLANCGTQFSLYRRHHLAKSAPDIAKAETNRLFEEMCRATLARLRAAHAVESAPDDAQIERMARAHYEATKRNSHPAFVRAATWEEACCVPGWRDEQLAAMRAALAVRGEEG